MTNFCGIDFGTSNSTVGVMVDGKPTLIEIEGEHKNIPSAIFYEFDEDEVVFGREALEYYRDDYEGRLLRSFKSVLGTSLMNDGTQIGYRRMKFITIIEQFISLIKQVAEEKCGYQLDAVVMGRPIHFSDINHAQDQKAEEMLKQAAENAGFKHVEFQYEPIAAALKYEMSLDSEKLAMIVDIGGGTSDISIIKLSPERSKHRDRTSDCLANSGVHIGGTDFDKNLNIKNVMPHLGFDQELKDGLTMPRHIYSDMTTWHRIHNIYTPKASRFIQQVAWKLKDKKYSDRLKKLLKERLAFRVALLVEDAKIRLSTEKEVSSSLDFLEKGLEAHFTQEDLQKAIDWQLESIGKTIRECMEHAEITEDDIDVIFLTGGSSQMKTIKDFVSNEFPGIQVDNQNSLSSVGMGLVVDASRRFECCPCK